MPQKHGDMTLSQDIRRAYGLQADSVVIRMSPTQQSLMILDDQDEPLAPKDEFDFEQLWDLAERIMQEWGGGKSLLDPYEPGTSGLPWDEQAPERVAS